MPTKEIKESALSELKRMQIAWLMKSGVEAETAGYTSQRDDNLFQPLCEDSIQDLGGAQGGELKRRRDGTIPPKFHAVHSSSALAANVFDYWRKRDLALLTTALESPCRLVRMQLEAKFSTGYGFPANLDVALWSKNDESVLAIESKYCEPFNPTKKSPLKSSYISIGGDSAWKKLGLVKCDEVARDVQRQPDGFDFLDVNQLLKHTLALKKKMGDNFRLLYLFYDVQGQAGERHRDEIERFKQSVDGEIDFEWMTYQTYVSRLNDLLIRDDVHSGYFDYLKSRYQLG